LAQGGHLGPHPARAFDLPRLRRRRAAPHRGPGRRCLPQRHADLLHRDCRVVTTTPHPQLTVGTTWPDLETFEILAEDRRVIPVVRRLMADAETPVGLYRKLAGSRPGTFLLESAEHGGVWSRYSIIGAASRATLTAQDGEVRWIGEPPAGVPTEGLATEALAATVDALATEPVP